MMDYNKIKRKIKIRYFQIKHKKRIKEASLKLGRINNIVKICFDRKIYIQDHEIFFKELKENNQELWDQMKRIDKHAYLIEEYMKHVNRQISANRNKKIKYILDRLPNILECTMNRRNIIKEKLPKYCTACNSELFFDHDSFSSSNSHYQVWLACDKCGVFNYHCFDENMNLCHKYPWEIDGKSLEQIKDAESKLYLSEYDKDKERGLN